MVYGLKTSIKSLEGMLSFDVLDKDLKIIFVSNLLAAFGDGFVVYLLPLFFRGLSANPENIGFLYSLSTAAAALTIIPGGFLADKYDRKKLLILGWTLWIPVPLVFFFATNWLQMIVPMFIYGVTFSGPAMSAYVLGHSREGKMSSAFTTLGAAYAIGYIFSPATAGFLTTIADTRVIFVLTAVFYSLAALTLTRITSQQPNKAENTDPPADEAKVKLVSSKFSKLILVSTLFAVMMFILSMISALVPQFLHDVYGYELSHVLYLGTITYLGSFLLSLAVGRIGDKYGKSKAISISMLLTGLALLLFISVGGFGFQAVASFFRGASFPMWAYMGVVAGSIAPASQQAKWISVVQTATRLSSIPASFVGGVLYVFVPQMPFMLCIIVVFAIAFITAFGFSAKKQARLRLGAQERKSSAMPNSARDNS